VAAPSKRNVMGKRPSLPTSSLGSDLFPRRA
jgi:hypothetical protein